jgi:hypothetical protein
LTRGESKTYGGLLSTSDVIKLAVAVGTGLLAVATFLLARKASDQADATLRLAETAELQLEATSTPVLRVARIGQPNEATRERQRRRSS